MLTVMQEPLKHDMVINFPANGFHLRFESTSQRLRLIEVYDITRLQVHNLSHPTTRY
jgi:hypothetical protein